MKSTRFTKKLAVIDGRRTYYWEKYPEKSQTVVFLHGFPGNHKGLLEMAHGFGTDYRLVLVDMPACGLSECMEMEHVLANYAEWLNNFLDMIDAQHVVLMGHSFGARVAMVFANKYKTRAEKIVFMTPVVKLEGVLAQIASLKGVIAKMLPVYMQKQWLSNRLYQYAVKMIIFKSASPKRKEEIFDMDMEESKNINVRATIEVFDEFYASDMSALAKGITIPSLIIAGDKDEVALLASVIELAGLFKNATLQVMENSGHLVPLERPLATATIITSWLTQKL